MIGRADLKVLRRKAAELLQAGAIGDAGGVLSIWGIPQLWEKPGTVLYVGASVNRFQCGDLLHRFGHEITILEIWPENCEHYANSDLVAHVVCGDVRDVDNLELPHEQYDIVMWWHGPEHVHGDELEAVLAALERRASRAIVLGSPWGYWEQGEYGGNPHEAHVLELHAGDYARLGYTVEPVGKNDDPDTGRLTAWKVTGPAPKHDGVAIGFPIVTGQPTWGLMRSVLNLEMPPGPVMISREWGLPVDEARNALVDWFLTKTDAEWLLQVDHDAVLHPQTVNRLLSWDKSIVSALAFVRMRPVMPSVVRQNGDGSFHWDTSTVREWVVKHKLWKGSLDGGTVLDPAPEGSLYPLFNPPGYSGMHCVLMRRDALEAIGAPWFARTKGCVGEDRYFFSKALVKGVEAYVDLSCVAGHVWGEVSMGVLDFMAHDALLHQEAIQCQSNK